jgi:hypothetical protein
MNPADDAPWIRARVAPPRAGGATIERVGPLTPYLTQTIVEDALVAGRGSTVLLEIRSDDSTQVLRRLQRRVQLLTGHGIRVTVRSTQGSFANGTPGPA